MSSAQHRPVTQAPRVESPKVPIGSSHVPDRLPSAQPGSPSRLRRKAARQLARADVELDGDRAWDLRVHDERLFRRVAWHGSLGLGEAYMDGWWDAEALDELFHRILQHDLDDSVAIRLPAVWNILRNVSWNLQRGRRAYQIGKRHYDLGNELYRRMLDQRMIYSCGYWQDAKDLNAAQEAKLELICRKLHLRPGMRLLDIGCGWGGLVRHAAERYDIDAVAVTVSKEQAAFARERCRDLPVDIRFQDYRDLGDEGFDRVVSVGMFEHVGRKNYRTFMKTAHRLLAPDGLHLLHTIGHPRSTVATDPWIARYIFPNSMLPSMAQITHAADGLFAIEDVHNIGPHYDPTLMAWWQNFSRHWDEIKPLVQDPERFHRMWRYYLLSSAAAFRAGKLQVWQVVMAKDRGVAGGYQSVR